MNTLAPIALFTYNRPWHTRQMIEHLKANELAGESDLFIFSDAPKIPEAEKSVREVREYIKTISGFRSISIIERDRNLGLTNSVIDGVTKIVNQYGKIIVLEDDLVTSPYFLKFMNDGLVIYKDEERVFGIAGFAYPHGNKDLRSTFFLRSFGSWGWATWGRAWNYFEKDTDKLLKTFTKTMIKEFNFDNSTDFWSQVIDNKQGKINSWAIYWYATIFLKNGLFLRPRDSFTENIGLDGSGVHCGHSSVFGVSLVQKYDIDFESDIQESKIARKAHVEYFKSLKVSFIKRVVNTIKIVLQGKK